MDMPWTDAREFSACVAEERQRRWLDRATAMLRCGATGQSVRLSGKEYRLMEYLLANQGHILTREQLALRIWGYVNEAGELY